MDNGRKGNPKKLARDLALAAEAMRCREEWEFQDVIAREFPHVFIIEAHNILERMPHNWTALVEAHQDFVSQNTPSGIKDGTVSRDEHPSGRSFALDRRPVRKRTSVIEGAPNVTLITDYFPETYNPEKQKASYRRQLEIAAATLLAQNESAQKLNADVTENRIEEILSDPPTLRRAISRLRFHIKACLEASQLDEPIFDALAIHEPCFPDNENFRPVHAGATAARNVPYNGSLEFRVKQFYDEGISTLTGEHLAEAVKAMKDTLGTHLPPEITLEELGNEDVVQHLLSAITDKYPENGDKLKAFLEDVQKKGELSDNNPLKTYKGNFLVNWGFQDHRNMKEVMKNSTLFPPGRG